MRIWTCVLVLEIIFCSLCGCKKTTTPPETDPLWSTNVPAPPDDYGSIPDYGSNREGSNPMLAITCIDEHSVGTLSEVGDVVSISGNISKEASHRFGSKSKLYILSRRCTDSGSQPWYTHNAAINTVNVGNRWRMANVPLRRHGPVGTKVEIKAVVDTDLPAGFFLSNDVVGPNEISSEIIKVQVGHTHRPSVMLTRIDYSLPDPDKFVCVLRKSTLDAELSDIPFPAYIYSVVQPDFTGARWLNGDGRREKKQWHGFAYFGRGGDEGDTSLDIRDDNKRFRVSVIVTSRPMKISYRNDDDPGINSDTWRQEVEPYIVASSNSVKVLRTREWGEPALEITLIGGVGVSPGGEGSPGYQPLPIERYGPVQGTIEANGAKYISKDNVWLLIQPLGEDINTTWRVLGGPWPVRYENSWGRPAVIMSSKADCKAGKTWLCVAGLAAPGINFSDPVTERQLNSFIALSPAVAIKPVEH